jgi:drug/metabolite transporter (DMT)-like permease
MLLSVPYSLGFAAYEAGGFRRLALSIREGRLYYAMAVPVQALIDIGFTLAFVYTTAANALLLIGLNPLWSALAGRLLLGDRLPPRTWAALVLALGCLLVILVPQATAKTTAEDEPAASAGEEAEAVQPSVAGNLIALGTGLLLSAYITIARKAGMATATITAASSSSSSSLASQRSESSGDSREGGSGSDSDSGNRKEGVSLVGAAAIGASLSAALALGVERARVLPTTSFVWTLEPWQFWLAAVGQGAGIGIVFVAMTVAPRYVTAAEIGTFCLLETLLGPLFVYLGYGDAPSVWTLVGGSLLLAVLAVHESYPLLFGGGNGASSDESASKGGQRWRLFSSYGGNSSSTSHHNSVGANTEIREASDEPTEESASSPLPCLDDNQSEGNAKGGSVGARELHGCNRSRGGGSGSGCGCGCGYDHDEEDAKGLDRCPI